MAGSSTTVTYDETGPIKKIIVDWTSDASDGHATATTKKISGRLVKGVTDPGSVAPTDNYDIAITDEKSVDVLAVCAGTLVNRDTTNTEEVYFFVKNADASPLSMAARPVVCDILTISITNAGNSKTGQLVLYWEP